MFEFNELTKRVVAFLDEMQNFGCDLRYDVSIDKDLDFQTIEVDFTSGVSQSLVYLLIRELCVEKKGIGCHNSENLFIYCDNA